MLHQAIYLFCFHKLSKNPSMVHFPPILGACERVRYQRQSSSPLEIEHHYLGSDSCSHFAPFFNTVAVDTATISYERFQERWCCTNTPQIHHFFSTNMSLATLTKWVHIPYLFTQVSNTLLLISSVLKDNFCLLFTMFTIHNDHWTPYKLRIFGKRERFCWRLYKRQQAYQCVKYFFCGSIGKILTRLKLFSNNNMC